MDVESLHELWASGEARRAGQAIYEAIPNASRPAWAADILEVASSQVPLVPTQIRAVAEIAREPKRWREAHAAFSDVRHLTQADQSSYAGDQVYASLLVVAENAAKVVYNASGEPAPFDYACGYRLVVSLRHLVDAVGSPELEQRVWGLLVAWLRRVTGRT